MTKIFIGAIRGRKSSPDGGIEQQLEVSTSDITHSITTVWKDNVVIEVEEIDEDQASD